jgi:hypothetical protein
MVVLVAVAAVFVIVIGTTPGIATPTTNVQYIPADGKSLRRPPHGNKFTKSRRRCARRFGEKCGIEGRLSAGMLGGSGNGTGRAVVTDVIV